MEDLLVDFLLNHFIVTIFYAVMDMQNDKHSNGESREHFALGAIDYAWTRNIKFGLFSKGESKCDLPCLVD